MAKLNPNKTALALGLVVATWVLLWSIVLMIGGQAFFGWLMGIHFISGLSLGPVTIGVAVTSIIYHFVVGAVLGWLFATIWNRVQ
jgi:hypothetical protein